MENVLYLFSMRNNFNLFFTIHCFHISIKNKCSKCYTSNNMSLRKCWYRWWWVVWEWRKFNIWRVLKIRFMGGIMMRIKRDYFPPRRWWGGGTIPCQSMCVSAARVGAEGDGQPILLNGCLDILLVFIRSVSINCCKIKVKVHNVLRVTEPWCSRPLWGK